MAVALEFLPSGDTALVVQFGDRVDRALSRSVLRLRDRIRAAALPGVRETVPTFRSLLVHYDPLATDMAELGGRIEALVGEAEAAATAARTWRIPVCYEGDLAPDLADVASRTGLSQQRVIELHSAVRYHVYMIGFLPGFPYMGDLPDELVLPRREDPRTRVPAGAVAIATTLSSIYTLESPGGWHLIGATPVQLFDVSRTPPALLAPGDAVVFEPVSEREFATIRAAQGEGTYNVPCEEAPA